MYAMAGLLLLVVAAELVGRFQLAGRAWPALSDVVAYVAAPSAASLIVRNAAVTLASAGWGFLFGVAAALLGAVLALVVPMLRPGLDRFAAIVHAVPTIALAPLLITTAGREDTPMIIAALGVSFLMFVTLTSAFGSIVPAQADLFAVMGANRWRQLARLDLPRVVPAFFDGLTLCAPAAVLGATIGEWFGAPRGLGLVLVSAMQNYQMTLLWAAAITATLASLTAYLVFGQLQRVASRRFT